MLDVVSAAAHGGDILIAMDGGTDTGSAEQKKNCYTQYIPPAFKNYRFAGRVSNFSILDATRVSEYFLISRGVDLGGFLQKITATVDYCKVTM